MWACLGMSNQKSQTLDSVCVHKDMHTRLLELLVMLFVVCVSYFVAR
jgi:hypothetical protein